MPYKEGMNSTFPFLRCNYLKTTIIYLRIFSDYHFLNGQLKYRPGDSLLRRTNFKYKSKAGPGADNYGEIPIPNELVYVRSRPSNEKEEPKSPNLCTTDENPKSYVKKDTDVKPRVSRGIPLGKVEKKLDLRIRNMNNSVVPFGRPISGKRAKKGPHKGEKHNNTLTKTTIQVTEEATVKVNKAEHKIVVQNKCTVAVHNRRKSLLI